MLPKEQLHGQLLSDLRSHAHGLNDPLQTHLRTISTRIVLSGRLGDRKRMCRLEFLGCSGDTFSSASSIGFFFFAIDALSLSRAARSCLANQPSSAAPSDLRKLTHIERAATGPLIRAIVLVVAARRSSMILAADIVQELTGVSAYKPHG